MFPMKWKKIETKQTITEFKIEDDKTIKEIVDIAVKDLDTKPFVLINYKNKVMLKVQKPIETKTVVDAIFTKKIQFENSSNQR